jgi:glycosyltransferase involved in cell wall biosynthesis
VLILHNAYQFPGGEERAVAADQKLLAENGHTSRLYQREYAEVAKRGRLGRARLGVEVFWSRGAYRDVRREIRRWRPDVAHLHNVFPLISPSAYAACRAEGVPIVQTLHNYRLVCPAATLLRQGAPCELCVGRVPWPAVRYECYRGSRAQSLAMASALASHSWIGTWNRVDAYIALTDFAQRIFVRGGLPAERIFVRPNAVERVGSTRYSGPHSAIFVGRLSQEKGVSLLIDAWRHLRDVPLTIVGDGPLLADVRGRVAAESLEQVEVTGPLSHPETLDRLRRAGMLVFPSIWYEGLPYAILEALAAAIPVIAARLGAQAEIVTDGLNGLLFEPSDALGLAAAVRKLVSSAPLAQELSRGAAEVFVERYSPERSYARLLDVYRYVGLRV